MDDSELIPYDLESAQELRTDLPLSLLLSGKQIEVFDMVLPKHFEGPFLAPFRAGGPTVSGSFDGELYPGAIERPQEMARNHPGYCSTCEGFPCQGGHPATEEDHR